MRETGRQASYSTQVLPYSYGWLTVLTSGRKLAVFLNFGLRIKLNFKLLSPDPKLTNGQGDTAPHPKKSYQKLCNVFTWESTASMKHLFLNEVMFLFYLIFQLGL